NGEKIYNSIRDIRKRIVYRRGNNLVMKLLVTNFVTGCAMIVKKQIALKSIPFAKTMVHDNWIAVVAALNGKIDYVDKRLVRYRQHSNNQTGILKDVYDKKTYFDIKIIDMIERYKELEFKMLNNKEVMPYITYCLKSLDIRKQYFLKPSINGIINMLRYSMYYKMSILLELFIPIMPEFIFKFIIRLAKKGIL
ncbi:MAG TPA: glycosyl transferase, partial [Clostridium sp.]|nr:glycosyl transferase [Clostridium sp.]